MKKCIDEKEIIRFIENDLGSEAGNTIRSHLKKCSRCRALADDLAAAEHFFTAYERPEPTADERAHYYRTLDLKFGKRAGFRSKVRAMLFHPEQTKLSWAIAGAAVVVFLVFIFASQNSSVPPVFNIGIITHNWVIKQSNEQITKFLNETEILLLEIKNASNIKVYKTYSSKAEKLINMIPLMHDVGMDQKNLDLLSFLIQSELIFYELANWDEKSADEKVDFIKEGVNSKQLWKTLTKLQDQDVISNSDIQRFEI